MIEGASVRRLSHSKIVSTLEGTSSAGIRLAEGLVPRGVG